MCYCNRTTARLQNCQCGKVCKIEVRDQSKQAETSRSSPANVWSSKKQALQELFVHWRHKNRGACSLGWAQQYQVEIHCTAAVIVTNISSKLLITRRWQLITIHTPGKYLGHTECTHTHSFTLTVSKAVISLYASVFVNLLNRTDTFQPRS